MHRLNPLGFQFEKAPNDTLILRDAKLSSVFGAVEEDKDESSLCRPVPGGCAVDEPVF